MKCPPIKLLIVDDEEDYRRSCVKFMTRSGYDVRSAASGAEAITLLSQSESDVAVFDIDMPGMDGLELLQRVKEAGFQVEVIFLTGKGTIPVAVNALQSGACDFLTKPCSLGDLEHRIALAARRQGLQKENSQLKALVSRSKPIPDLVGDSPRIFEVRRMIERIAPTDKPILIDGESGTGKEVVARIIQAKSQLADRPFVTINCAALPEQLVESELFGHQKGAFTGAIADKPGLFEIADGGTLFIDEVGELPLSLQPKLLRVLEDGSMRRIGCNQERTVRVRLIAATNRNLDEEVVAGRFRQDLLYRINVLCLTLPPLRARMGDVELLARHFLPSDWFIEKEALTALAKWKWPGNVRELINVIERAKILSDQNTITCGDLPREIAAATGQSGESPAINESQNSEIVREGLIGDPESTIDFVLKAHVLAVLDKFNGNKARTARALGVHRRKLYRLLERFESMTEKEHTPESRPQETTSLD